MNALHTRHTMMLIIGLMMILTLPTLAQDAAATVEAAPIAVVTAEAPLTGSTTTINVNAPAAEAPTSAPSSSNILALTLGELIGILVGLGALMVGIGKILWDGNQPGQPNVDARLTTWVDTAASDRDWMSKMERLYELGGIQNKTTVDALTSVISTLAPLTGFKADDALMRLLKDVQQSDAGVSVPDPLITTSVTVTSTGVPPGNGGASSVDVSGFLVRPDNG